MNAQRVVGIGFGWPQLEAKVDQLVDDFMTQEKLPGMTVAVTKNGRLILTKGYGFANTDKNKAMEPFMRSRIGSVTKCVVTGPVAWNVMQEKGIDPKTQRLYGPGGLFGTRFDADIRAGIEKHKPTQDWMSWYRKITLQNLLDHRAGFESDGDQPGAAKAFGVSMDDLTYTHVHRFFLRDKKLLYEPGTTPPPDTPNGGYSNHGFGLWTLLTEEISGQSYRSYVSDRYLRPLGLHMYVLPEREKPDPRDAWNHQRNSKGEPVPSAFEDSGLGLAAGGFRASAQDLARLMAHLEGKYTQAQLDAMGWGMEPRGKLAHNGLIGGGTAHVAMFPQGYKSLSNLDLSRVHIALVTNIRFAKEDVSKLVGLGSKIALEVPVANVPESFSIMRFLRRDVDTGGDFSEISMDGSVAAVLNSQGNLQLIPYQVSDQGGLRRGQVVEAGKASDVNLVHPKPTSANAVTALRDSDGNLKTIAWQITGAGQVARQGDAAAGPVKDVALTPFPDGNGVVTATRGNQDDLKLVAWELTSSQRILRRGDISAGPVKHVAVTTTNFHFPGVVSATVGADNKLKLIAWKFDLGSKTFSRKGDAQAGEITGGLNIVRAPLNGKDIVVTALKDESGNLKLISWLVDPDGQVSRKDSASAGRVSLVHLEAGQNGQVFATVKDGDGNLRIIAYKVHGAGQIERVGTGVAGEVSRIASSYIQRNGREFLLTAVRDGENKLRTICWELD
jgi:CubicO group peptidase (beta-lactamase class C family)